VITDWAVHQFLVKKRDFSSEKAGNTKIQSILQDSRSKLFKNQGCSTQKCIDGHPITDGTITYTKIIIG
jgi:hypothetical protein